MNLIIYLSILIVLILGTFALGHGLLYKVKLVDTFSIFLKMLVGSIAAAGMFALYQTEGKSIYASILPLLLVLVFYINRGKTISHHSEKIDPRLLLYLILTGAIFFGLNYHYVHGLFQKELSFQSLSDTHFVNSISYYLAQTGQENEFHFLNELSSNYHGNSPYHYWELWLSALIGTIFEINFLAGFTITIYTYFQILAFLGLLSLVNQYFDTKKVKWYLLSISIFFSGYISIGNQLLPWEFLQGDFYAGTVMFGSPKQTSYVILLCLFFLLYKKGMLLESILSLLLFAFINFTPIPALLGFIIPFLLFQSAFDSNNTTYKKAFFFSIFFVVLFFLNKFLFSTSGIERNATSITGLVSSIINSNIGFIKTGINVLIGSGMILFFRFSVLLVITLYILRKTKISTIEGKGLILAMMVIGICLSGLFSYALLHEIVDSFQLFFAIASPILSLWILLQLLSALKKKRLHTTSILITLSILVISNVIFLDRRLQLDSSVLKRDPSYLSQIDDFIDKSPNKIGASFRSSYSTVFSAKTYIYTNGDYLSSLANGAYTVSLTDFSYKIPSDELTKKQVMNSLKLGIFYNYVIEKELENTFTSINQAQVEFIRKHNLRYGICEPKYEIPDEIRKIISVQIVDPISLEKFIIFKP